MPAPLQDVLWKVALTAERFVPEDVPGDRRLVAYLQPRHLPAPPAREAKAFLRELLPDYMLPSSVVWLEMPMTPTGKVDRRALPAPEAADTAPAQEGER